uniref:Uncharacterized protein n=1 Tax=Oryza sativa subsp. japonica TaxID=39947 RepID=Q84PX2_ORYSJ|nr:hypothetical protein [Oryza sativa Japonica Group]
MEMDPGACALVPLPSTSPRRRAALRRDGEALSPKHEPQTNLSQHCHPPTVTCGTIEQY